jgi:hypothetical protein
MKILARQIACGTKIDFEEILEMVLVEEMSRCIVRHDELDVDANDPCFPGMQQLILAKCISGVRMDSNDYNVGWVQAIHDYFNQFQVPTYPKSYAVPVKAINHERTICAVGSRDAAGARINSTNACYAGYYDHLLPLCYLSHLSYM